MNDCCCKQLDKAIRVGRASYRCPSCRSDVSLAYQFYLDALDFSCSIKQGVIVDKEKIKETIKDELEDILTDEIVDEIKETIFTKLTHWLKRLLRIK